MTVSTNFLTSSVYWDNTRAVKERFDAEGITIPYPQRDVHVHGESTPTEPLEPRPVVSEYTEPQETVSTTGTSADED
jgi:small-conductance mechanosensitive channel